MMAWLSGEDLRVGRVALSPPLLWAGGFWRVVMVRILLLCPGSSQKGTTCSWGSPSGLRFPWAAHSFQAASLYFLFYFYCGRNA